MSLPPSRFPHAILLAVGIGLALFVQESKSQCTYTDFAPEFSCGCLDRSPESDGDDSCRRATLTGDWWGARPSLEDHGVDFDAAVTQFYQGVASGGRRRRFAYGGHGDYEMSLDLGKLCALDGFRIELGGEHRFGETVNRDTGSIIPVALLPGLPDPETDHLALTTVVLIHELSERIELLLGKLDTLEFDTNAFADGNGRDRFFSTAFNYNPISTRTIPFSTLGAGFNLLRDDERIFTLLVVNTEDTPTTIGIDELFANGATVFAEFRLPVELFGRRGHQMFGGSWSSGRYTSLRQTGRVDFPDIPIATREGSWALGWNADQYLWEDPGDSTRGWGLFGRAGISDGNPNPIEWFLSFGVGGRGPLASRPDDEFGVGWYYTGLSDEFGPLVSGVLQDGQGVELYYNIAINQWCRITPDLQIVTPNAVATDTALVAGVRVRIEF